MKRCTLILLLLVLALSACSSGTPEASPTIPEDLASATPFLPRATGTFTPSPTVTEAPLPTPTNTPTPLPVEYGPDNFPAQVNPLTGLAVADPQLLERRPVAVKINLVPRTTNRPPWGVS